MSKEIKKINFVNLNLLSHSNSLQWNKLIEISIEKIYKMINDVKNTIEKEKIKSL